MTMENREQEETETIEGSFFRILRFDVASRSMRVCIDIQSAVTQLAGVGRYTRELVTRLGPLAKPGELGLFHFDFQRKGVPFPVPGAVERAVRWIPGRIVQGAWKKIGWPPFDALAGEADVFHFPNFIRPPLRRGKSVVTIHDVAFLRHPETIEAGNYRYLSGRIRDTVENADAIVTVSEFTAGEVTALLGAPRHKVHAIPSGLGAGIGSPGEAAAARVRAKHGLARPYLLSVGTLEPRKNYGFLVALFEKLGGFRGDLVIAGMRGWKDRPILARMEASSRRQEIRYLEYVADEDLPGLYAGASLFVYPSLYEGFGFPPLEAMACGAPVVAARAGALPEVLGEAAELVEGYDADVWAGAVSCLLGDEARRRRLAALGAARAGRFTWEATAQATWALYRKLGT
jgi:glycosyltransferase involved in cell wall biosynthesis